MNEKKDPPKRKSIPRQMVMKEAFDANYQPPKLPPECVACKNTPDLPCDGCDHREAKKAVMQSKKLAASAVGALRSPMMLKHDIVDKLMTRKHQLEEELDEMSIAFGFDREKLRGQIAGFEEAITIVRGID